MTLLICIVQLRIYSSMNTFKATSSPYIYYFISDPSGWINQTKLYRFVSKCWQDILYIHFSLSLLADGPQHICSHAAPPSEVSASQSGVSTPRLIWFLHFIFSPHQLGNRRGGDRRGCIGGMGVCWKVVELFHHLLILFWRLVVLDVGGGV